MSLLRIGLLRFQQQCHALLWGCIGAVDPLCGFIYKLLEGVLVTVHRIDVLRRDGGDLKYDFALIVAVAPAPS